jgi:hypothetical protein
MCYRLVFTKCWYLLYVHTHVLYILYMLHVCSRGTCRPCRTHRMRGRTVSAGSQDHCVPTLVKGYSKIVDAHLQMFFLRGVQQWVSSVQNTLYMWHILYMSYMSCMLCSLYVLNTSNTCICKDSPADRLVLPRMVCEALRSQEYLALMMRGLKAQRWCFR